MAPPTMPPIVPPDRPKELEEEAAEEEEEDEDPSFPSFPAPVPASDVAFAPPAVSEVFDLPLADPSLPTGAAVAPAGVIWNPG